MDCQEVKKLLLVFLEGELPLKDQEEIEAHLGSCESCQKERYQLSKSWRMLESFEAPKLPDNFTASLMNKIHSQGPQRNETRPPSRWAGLQPLISGMAGGAVMGLVVLLVAYFFWKNIPESRMTRLSESATLNLNIPQATKTVIPEKDRAVIQNLDILQNADFLQHINMLKDIDVIVNPKIVNM